MNEGLQSLDESKEYARHLLQSTIIGLIYLLLLTRSCYSVVVTGLDGGFIVGFTMENHRDLPPAQRPPQSCEAPETSRRGVSQPSRARPWGLLLSLSLPIQASLGQLSTQAAAPEPEVSQAPMPSPSPLPLPPAQAPASTPGLDSLPLVLRGPWLQSASPTRITFRWRTDQAVDSVVWYGPSLTQLNQIVRIEGARTEHEVSLTNLVPNTVYYYAIGYVSGILSGGDGQHFRTPPAVGSSGPVRVWAIGDFGSGDSRETSMRDAYYRYATESSADVWLMLGDNAYPDGTDADYQKAVFSVFGDILKTTPVWPTLGNHDAHSADSPTSSGPYYDIFVLPKNGESGGIPSNTEAWYAFDYANIHFICLDSADSSRSSTGPMATWLKQDLAANHANWTIAFWHHPPYSKGSHDSDTEVELVDMRKNVVPILEAAGVDLVLAGHSHAYERSYLINGHYNTSDTLTPSMILDGGSGDPSSDGEYRKPNSGLDPNKGAVYVVAGNGAVLQGGSLDHPVMYTSQLVMGSLVLNVQGNVLEGRMLDSTGAFRDAFTLRKAAGPLPPQPGDFRLEPDSESITLRWTDLSTDETGYEVQRSTDGRAWTSIHTTAPNSSGYPDADIQSSQTYYYRMRTRTATDASAFTMTEAAALTTSGCSTPTARTQARWPFAKLETGLAALGLGLCLIFFRKRFWQQRGDKH